MNSPPLDDSLHSANPVPIVHPVPTVAATVESILNPFPALLAIPEATARTASPLNLLAPVAAGVDPGGNSSQVFNASGGAAVLPPSPQGPQPMPAQTIAEIANDPSFLSAQMGSQTPAVTADPAAPEALSGPSVVQAPAVSAAELNDPLAIPQDAISVIAPEEMGLQPGVLQQIYRAPLAAGAIPLQALRSESDAEATAPFQVAATYSLTPLGDEASRQAFNLNQPAHALLPAEDLSEEAALAYAVQTAPETIHILPGDLEG